MQIAGMICEYNPFHLGHLALVEETRRQGATHIAAVMSGNYVQRGEPALLEKRMRAKQALRCGPCGGTPASLGHEHCGNICTGRRLFIGLPGSRRHQLWK